MFFFEGGQSERAITEHVVSVVATGEIRAVLTIHAGKHQFVLSSVATFVRC